MRSDQNGHKSNITGIKVKKSPIIFLIRQSFCVTARGVVPMYVRYPPPAPPPHLGMEDARLPRPRNGGPQPPWTWEWGTLLHLGMGDPSPGPGKRGPPHPHWTSEPELAPDQGPPPPPDLRTGPATRLGTRPGPSPLWTEAQSKNITFAVLCTRPVISKTSSRLRKHHIARHESEY